MRRLRNLIEEKVHVKTDFKEELEGVCDFCGEEGVLSSSVVKKVMERANNPGITLYTGKPVSICYDCSIVYENITKPSPRQVFERNFMVIDEKGNYRYVEDIEQLKDMPIGRYLFIYVLKRGNKLPTNFYTVQSTINPSKNIVLNVIEGSVIYPVLYETDELISKVMNKDYKKEHLINSIRKHLGG